MRTNNGSQLWFSPVIAPVLRNRLETFLIAGFGVLQAGLAYAHIPGWPCPIKAATGIPCPGCGLSAAVGELLHGRWQESLQAHAFAIFFVAALAVMAAVLVLPAPARGRIIKGIEGIERRTGATALFLVCFLIYWGLRLGKLL